MWKRTVHAPERWFWLLDLDFILIRTSARFQIVYVKCLLRKSGRTRIDHSHGAVRASVP